MASFHARIYEADDAFFEGELESLVVPARDGRYGIMAGHENLVLAIVPGVLQYKLSETGEEKIASVSYGMIRVEKGDVLMIVDSAEHPEEIDENRAREQEAAAREAMLQKRSLREYALAESTLKRAVSRLKVKSKM